MTKFYPGILKPQFSKSIQQTYSVTCGIAIICRETPRIGLSFPIQNILAFESNEAYHSIYIVRGWQKQYSRSMSSHYTLRCHYYLKSS